MAAGEAAGSARLAAARAGAAPLLLPRGPEGRQGRPVLDWDAQEARDRPRAAAPAVGDLHGRADDRAGRLDAADALGVHHGRPHRVRRHDPVDDALYRGGRRAVRADRHHRQRADHRGGDPERAEGAGARRLCRPRDTGRVRPEPPAGAPRGPGGPTARFGVDHPGRLRRGVPSPSPPRGPGGGGAADQRGEAEPGDDLPRADRRRIGQEEPMRDVRRFYMQMRRARS